MSVHKNNWSGALRTQLASRARDWANRNSVPYYESIGTDPTLMFECSSSRDRHGNFHPISWDAIRSNPEWSRRLDKPHSQKRALPIEKQANARELDSSNSSDALLMNCFCFPGAATTLLGVSSSKSSLPEFGFSPNLPLDDGRTDSTEIDMKLDGFIVEAKLTESDFTERAEEHVRRYAGLESQFDVSALPRNGDSIRGYQLIRNVLAAAHLGVGLIVLIDGRRPDLLQEWWRVHAAIADSALRLRCGFLTWQEIASQSPSDLKTFLREKYGL